jgi:hypothetical protein
MKKILTLMVMFAMTAGILSTQAQTLSYQVVVRDVNNNLVVNQELTVSVEIYSPINSSESALQENITATTNLNGMLSLTLNKAREEQEQTPWEEYAIDWTNAKIVLNFNNDNINNVVDTVYAVPYAMQANFLLTTNQIVNYIQYAQPSDWNKVYAALKGNEDFLNAMRDTVVKYVKANYPIAKQIAFHYLSQMTAADVNEAYDTIDKVLTNQEIADALNVVIMDYVQKHRSLAYEVARYYAQHANPEGLQKVYDAAMTREDVVNPIMDSVLLVFLKEFGLDPACMTDYNYTFCELLDAAANLGDMGVCTGIAKVQNSVGDGLYALYENQGVVYTAYVTNFRNSNVVTDYGFRQVSKNDPTQVVTFRPGNYQAITNQFGKFTYTMDNTETCGDTLLVTAFVTLNPDSVPDGCSNSNTSVEMTVVVPTFEIAVSQVQGTNTVKATFTPAVAQDVFNVKKNNVKWIINGQESEVTGLSFELVPGTTYTSIQATARLGSCTKESNVLTDIVAQ